MFALVDLTRWGYVQKAVGTEFRNLDDEDV